MAKVGNALKYTPQGLKPQSFCGNYGTSEVVPCYKTTIVAGC